MPFAFRNLKLENPLCILDLETTGVDSQVDRIVEVALVRYEPAGGSRRFRRLIDPGRPIPPTATSVHGIADGDVAGCPDFACIAGRLLQLLEGCDLAGFNIRRFDLPFLAAELERAGHELKLEGRSILDAMQIFHRQHPRDLATAVRCYLGHEHEGAHSALDDVRATAAVLDAQVGADELPETPSALHRLLVEVDVGGKFRRDDGRVVMAFGKYAGESLRSVARRDPGYLRWLLNQGLLDDARSRIISTLRKASHNS